MTSLVVLVSMLLEKCCNLQNQGVSTAAVLEAMGIAQHFIHEQLQQYLGMYSIYYFNMYLDSQFILCVYVCVLLWS